MIVVDYVRQWVEVIPLKKIDQNDVINSIEENIVFWIGVPETITTNQGFVFTWRKVVAYYYALENGQVEVVNKILTNLIFFLKKNILNKDQGVGMRP